MDLRIVHTCFPVWFCLPEVDLFMIIIVMPDLYPVNYRKGHEALRNIKKHVKL